MAVAAQHNASGQVHAQGRLTLFCTHIFQLLLTAPLKYPKLFISSQWAVTTMGLQKLLNWSFIHTSSYSHPSATTQAVRTQTLRSGPVFVILVFSLRLLSLLEYQHRLILAIKFPWWQVGHDASHRSSCPSPTDPLGPTMLTTLILT